MAKIVFKYDQSGGVEIDGQGFKGAACEKATADFIRTRRKTSDTKKPEFYQAAGQGLKTTL